MIRRTGAGAAWGWAVTLCSVAILASLAAAQEVTVGPAFTSQVRAQNVGGGLSHLSDGDLLAFTSSTGSGGPSLVRIDANGDGFPAGGTKTIAQFPGQFPSFVQVAPSGTFALIGLTGFAPGFDEVQRVNLNTDVVLPYLTAPGNYDLTFIDDNLAYLSSNPQGFDPTGPNEVSLVQLGANPVVTPVVRISGVPSATIALNAKGDLYYVRGTFSFPAPPLSSRLLRFSAAALADAAAGGAVLDESDSETSVPLPGGYDMVFHQTSVTEGELFLSDFSNLITRISEPALVPETFATITAQSFFPSATGLSFFQRRGLFTNTGVTHSELAGSMSDFANQNFLFQIRPTTYVPTATDELGFCSPGADDCLFQELRPSACVGANGFLSQVNIASIINLSAAPLGVAVRYFDFEGVMQDEVLDTISPSLKRDYIINDLGLKPDTIGTVCVSTNGGPGSWTGGIAIYKPDLRRGTQGFGDAFDFALYYPFLNPFEAPVTLPLNTYHLGTDPQATVANWVAIIDAARDGKALRGKLQYFGELGTVVAEEAVDVPDGGRRDFAGHVGIAGAENRDAVGLAKFVPENPVVGPKAPYYMTVTRYFYDCVGSSCENFLTAFNLPYRPGTTGSVHGGGSTANGEISIVELNNVSGGSVTAGLQLFSEAGGSLTIQPLGVAALATRHTILNKSGETGFLADNTVSSATVSSVNGFVSATSLFYKLDKSGKLEYAYAAPMTGSPGMAQLSQFNSYISQQNVPELFNSSAAPLKVELTFLSNSGTQVESRSLTLPSKGTARISDLAIRPNDYGTIVINGDAEGLVVRNYVQRPGQYTLAFGAE